MGEAILWGAVAAAPLLVVAVLAMLRKWPPRLLGIVLGFGAGADGVHRVRALGGGAATGGPIPLFVGVAAGAIAYYVGDRLVERRASKGAGGPWGLCSTASRNSSYSASAWHPVKASASPS